MPADAPPVALDNELFLKNMAVLWANDPALALAVDRVDDADLPPLEPTRSGPPTLRRRVAGGDREIYLHSRYDPLKEAGTWASKTLTDDKFCYVIEGMGLGYHVRALADELVGEILLIVVEPDLAVLRLALSTVDFSGELQRGLLIILTATDKNRIHAALSAVGAGIMMGTRVAALAPAVQASPEFFSQMRGVVTEFINYTKTALVTLVINSQITCRNVARNLATYMATPPINPLKDRFKGHPAIVISAGPSLRRNAHLLPEAMGRAVLIATQTTLKPMLQRRVVPDFVCSLDYHELSKHYYEGIEDFHDIHLVAEPKAHPAVIDAFAGPVSLLRNEFAALCLGGAHDRRDGLPAGASVAHLAFYLAEYMGCDPIVLVGQDLALTGHVYYAPGTALHSTWHVETNRFCTMEMKEWEYIVRYRPLMRTIRGQNGETLYTEDLMVNYLEQFEKDIARTPVRVINATEGGALIRGAEHLPLRRVIDECCREPIAAERFAYRREARHFDASRLADGRAQVRSILDEMDGIGALCRETLEVLEALTKLVDRPAEFNRRIKQVDRLRLKIREYARTYDVICAGAQMAEFRRFSADQRLKASGATGAERARRQLNRDIEFVRTLQSDTQRMVAILQEALRRFDRPAEAR